MDVAEPVSEQAATSPVERQLPPNFGQLSYSKQYDHLFASMPLDVRKPVPKPSPEAQRVQLPSIIPRELAMGPVPSYWAWVMPRWVEAVHCCHIGFWGFFLPL